MKFERIDLHVHSAASDGSESPAAIVRQASALPLFALALTDHDTLDGLAEAEQEAAQSDIIFIRGCEISTATPWGEAHFLGLWIPKNKTRILNLENALDDMRAKRHIRNLRTAEKLRTLGFDVSYEAAEALAGGRVVGRPHFAELLCRLRVVKTRKDAFRTYLGKDCPAFVERELLSPEQAISLLKEAGALVSMAHPRLLAASVDELRFCLGPWKEQGLDALEAYHSEHNAKNVRECIELATHFGFQLSGGSDFHGLSKPCTALGTGKGGLRVGRYVYDSLMEYRAAHGMEE